MKNTGKFSWIATLAVAGALAGGPARSAINLVQNGDMSTFSSGAVNEWYNYGARLADWSLAAAPGNIGSQGVVFGPGAADTTGAVFETGYVAGVWGPGKGVANGLPATSPAGGNYFGADDPATYNQVLSQTITGLTVGQSYTLHFYWAAGEVWVAQTGGAPYAYYGASENQIKVSFGSQSDVTPMQSIASQGFSGWVHGSYGFTAANTSQALSFLFESAQPTGVPPIALLAGVSLTAGVPEPTTWAMMVLGFAGLALVGLRSGRRKAAAAD